MPNKPSSMYNYTQILQEAYEEFLLPLGDKKVPTPYRLNIPYQPDRRKYGKSGPKTLTKDAIEIAKEQGFNLKNSDIREIRSFMEKNWLGIDCSGLVYHLLDHLLEKVGKGNMESNGFPKVSRTNVEILTSDESSIPINDFKLAKPGDVIRLNSEQPIPHVLIVLDAENHIITYAHSSNLTKVKGVHQGQIKNGKLDQELKAYSYNVSQGDGIRRLKILA